MEVYGKHKFNIDDDLQYPYRKIMFMRALQSYSF